MTSFVGFLIFLLSTKETKGVFIPCNMKVIEECSGDIYGRLCPDEREECGPCQEGYVEMRDMFPSCVKINDNLWHNFQTVYELYKDGDNTDEKILTAQLLNTSAQFISKHNIKENSSYTLGLTPYR